MGCSIGGCRNSGRGDLGIACFSHQQFTGAAAGRVMDGDSQSPSYLGKGELNVPALFNSFLAFCLAAIVFVLLHGWSQRKPAPVRVKMMRVPKKVSQPTAGPLSIMAPPEPVAVAAQTVVAPPPAPQISQAPVSVAPVPAPQQSKPTPPPVVAPAKPAKPQPPKEVLLQHCRGTH